ncbi:MAG: DUF58 domain-containing protein, partial [Spirochaetota bacterium]
MPTLRGVVLAAFASILLVAGLLRNELGTVVFAGGLLILELTVITIAAIGGARLRAVRSRFAGELARPMVEAGERAGVRARIPSLGVAPGFALRHEVSLDGQGGRRLRSEHDVRPGAEAAWDLVADERGVYTSEGSALALVDLFGFTRSAVRDATPLRLIVLPRRLEASPSFAVQRGGERAAERTHHRVRSEELREVRPYVPGDDIRRVSWKHLAAHDELLVRVGEFIPPSRGELRCRIDAFVPPRAGRLETGDRLMETLRAVVDEALARGVLVRCAAPGEESPLVIRGETLRSQSSPEALRVATFLAGFVPGGAPSGGRGERL